MGIFKLSKQDIEHIQEGLFTPIDDGEHEFTIIEAADANEGKSNPSKFPGYRFVLQTAKEQRLTTWEYLNEESDASAARVAALFKAAGLTEEPENLEDWVGLKLKAEVMTITDNSGRPRKRIAYFKF